ncbi:DUF3634 family protein [Luteolibacter marinus]|uniref:DUF3634 family protein n=1 Tax=Luteolibacter marinus TaxID=2776705 RepID=UPI001866234C|nr:DUF3634 family protein [Luteolibacter marinus]
MLWFLKLTSALVLVIREGRLEVAKGNLPAHSRRAVEELLAGASVRDATLHTDGSGRIHFSRQVPRDLHQRLRNVLAST